MFNKISIYSFILALALLLTGCSVKEKPNTGFSKVEVNPTESQIAADETVSSDVHTPMVWEQTLEFGRLIFTIDNVELITNANDIGEGGFGEHSEVTFFNGEYYELASNNWMEYGDLYETIYRCLHGWFLYDCIGYYRGK